MFNEQEVVDLVVYAGKLMLESGSEIYRSEETMVRIAASYGIKDLDIFTLATCIYVTCEVDGNSYTRIKRVYPQATNLTRISQINQLSRDLSVNLIPVKECKGRLKEIEGKPRAKKQTVALTMAMACAVFAYMLQGCNLQDFIWTAVISYFSYWLLDWLNRYPSIHLMVKNTLVTIFISICSIICVESGLGSNIDDLIVGCIMLLVPGVAITNAVRDLLNGDILSGTIRAIEAVVIATGIALGGGIVLFLYKHGIGGIL